jgi:hypothetical protein
VAISGATSTSLTVTPVTSANYGVAYSVLVDDLAYSVWSSNAFIVPATGPSIITQPVSRAAVVGSSPSFSVTAQTSSGITNYQWMYYGTNLSGATGRTLTLTGVQSNGFGGPYTVAVSDGTTSVTSSSATLTFASAPSITAPGYGANNFTLTFGSQFGPSYVVDFKSSLTNAAWTPVHTNAGTGSPITVTISATGPQGFYRIRLQ